MLKNIFVIYYLKHLENKDEWVQVFLKSVRLRNMSYFNFFDF